MPEPEQRLLRPRWTARHVSPGLPVLCLLIAAGLGISGGLETAAKWGPFGHVQTSATSYLDSSQRKAIEAFAAGRAINAAASILKSAELTPFVVKVAPLELLEPIDDLAKQFSDVMAISLVAILLQRLLLAVSQAWAFDVVLPLGCMLWLLAIALYRWPNTAQRLSRLGRSMLILAIFARCVVPLAGWAGSGLTERFLAGDLNQAVATMDAARGSLEQFTFASRIAKPADPAADNPAPASAGAATPPAQSWEDWLSSKFNMASEGAAAGAGAVMGAFRAWVPDGTALAAMVKALADVPNQIVTAIEIFLVQTIVTPLVVAALLYAALRSVTRPTR